MKKQYLIATDGSPGACEAVREGTALAREAGAAITLVCVRHSPLPVLGDPYYQRTLSEELTRAQGVVAEAAASVAAEGVEVETEILEGNPADSIAELARFARCRFDRRWLLWPRRHRRRPAWQRLRRSRTQGRPTSPRRQAEGEDGSPRSLEAFSAPHSGLWHTASMLLLSGSWT